VLLACFHVHGGNSLTTAGKLWRPSWPLVHQSERVHVLPIASRTAMGEACGALRACPGSGHHQQLLVSH
jgi:hypothetical protein